jgi:hypothetical protein
MVKMVAENIGSLYSVVIKKIVNKAKKTNEPVGG